jgi:hypothetical protein
MPYQQSINTQMTYSRNAYMASAVNYPYSLLHCSWMTHPSIRPL